MCQYEGATYLTALFIIHEDSRSQKFFPFGEEEGAVLTLKSLRILNYWHNEISNLPLMQYITHCHGCAQEDIQRYMSD